MATPFYLVHKPNNCNHGFSRDSTAIHVGWLVPRENTYESRGIERMTANRKDKPDDVQEREGDLDIRWCTGPRLGETVSAMQRVMNATCTRRTATAEHGHELVWCMEAFLLESDWKPMALVMVQVLGVSAGVSAGGTTVWGVVANRAQAVKRETYRLLAVVRGHRRTLQ